MLNISTEIIWINSLQEFQCRVEVFDEVNTYDEITFYDHDARFLWFRAQQVWFDWTFKIQEAHVMLDVTAPPTPAEQLRLPGL